MNLRFIYWGGMWLILAIVVYGIFYFSAKQIFSPPAKAELQIIEPVVEPPLLQPPLIPPFDEKEIRPASSIWQRWENLKRETDMPVE